MCARFGGMALRVWMLTLFHGMMGAALGAITSEVAGAWAAPRLLNGNPAEAMVLCLALCSWMAIGAGISGFILTSVNRADAR